jgi:hypothetical protein
MQITGKSPLLFWFTPMLSPFPILVVLIVHRRNPTIEGRISGRFGCAKAQNRRIDEDL